MAEVQDPVKDHHGVARIFPDAKDIVTSALPIEDADSAVAHWQASMWTDLVVTEAHPQRHRIGLRTYVVDAVPRAFVLLDSSEAGPVPAIAPGIEYIGLHDAPSTLSDAWGRQLGGNVRAVAFPRLKQLLVTGLPTENSQLETLRVLQVTQSRQRELGLDLVDACITVFKAVADALHELADALEAKGFVEEDQQIEGGNITREWVLPDGSDAEDAAE